MRFHWSKCLYLTMFDWVRVTRVGPLFLMPEGPPTIVIECQISVTAILPAWRSWLPALAGQNSGTSRCCSPPPWLAGSAPSGSTRRSATPGKRSRGGARGSAREGYTTRRAWIAPQLLYCGGRFCADDADDIFTLLIFTRELAC